MRIKLFCASVGCALAIGAASAATASAAPEFLHLGSPLSLTAFTGKTSGAVEIADPALGLKVRCLAGTLEGLIEPGSTTAVEEVLAKFHMCSATVAVTGKVVKCKVRSAGQAFGTIRTKRLGGDLVPVPAAEAADEVGLDLKAEVGTVITSLIFSPTACGPPRVVEGSVISEVAPKGPPETTGKNLNSLAAPGPKQMIQFLPSGLKDTLAIGSTEAVLTSIVALKFAETLEVT
jgi:hypothetical protein